MHSVNGLSFQITNIAADSLTQSVSLGHFT